MPKKISITAFEKLLADSRVGERQQGRTSRIKKALRLYLVDGMTMLEAARRSGNVSPQAVYKTLARLRPQKKKAKPRLCPHCGKSLVLSRSESTSA